MLSYELGEMRSVDGVALRYEVEFKASHYAVIISHMVELSPYYKALAEKLPSPRLLLYFQKIIKTEIFPFIRQACVIQCRKRDGIKLSSRENAILIPKYGMLSYLLKTWAFEDVPIKAVNPILFCMIYRELGRRMIKDKAKIFFRRIITWLETLPALTAPYVQDEKPVMLACHYGEGIDLSRRNDLNWFPGSGIDPKRVMIYFDDSNHNAGKPIKRKVIEQLKAMGIGCVALKKGVIEERRGERWRAPRLPKKTLLRELEKDSPEDKWIRLKANELLKEVYRWSSFYDKFNIKITYLTEEGRIENIAQAIACDIGREHGGLIIGKQRSETFLPLDIWVGHHPKHVFFIWNKRTKHYFDSSHDKIENFIVSGYPDYILKKDKNLCAGLRSGGINFIIALFDNVFGPDIQISKTGIIEFYKSFLEWSFEDPGIGLIIKTKKPSIINNLSSLTPLFKQCIDKRQCVKVEGAYGRFPSDASAGADMAVGIGISSAVVEAVIAGCRGVHYDITNLRKHEFYKWGYEKLVFNDLKKMIAALKRYRINPDNEPALGDWSAYIDRLDSFRDEKGGRRMGTYMRWLLEAFDEEKKRTDAIEYANRLYAEQWGNDKVINARGRHE